MVGVTFCEKGHWVGEDQPTCLQCDREISPFYNNEANKLAAKQLMVPSDWVVVSTSVTANHLCDSEDVLEKLDGASASQDEVEDAINDSVIDIALPPGWRVVGMRKPDGDGQSERTYGLVDFSSLGAA